MRTIEIDKTCEQQKVCSKKLLAVCEKKKEKKKNWALPMPFLITLHIHANSLHYVRRFFLYVHMDSLSLTCFVSASVQINAEAQSLGPSVMQKVTCKNTLQTLKLVYHITYEALGSISSLWLMTVPHIYQSKHNLWLNFNIIPALNHYFLCLPCMALTIRTKRQRKNPVSFINLHWKCIVVLLKHLLESTLISKQCTIVCKTCMQNMIFRWF